MGTIPSRPGSYSAPPRPPPSLPHRVGVISTALLYVTPWTCGRARVKGGAAPHCTALHRPTSPSTPRVPLHPAPPPPPPRTPIPPLKAKWPAQGGCAGTPPPSHTLTPTPFLPTPTPTPTLTEGRALPPALPASRIFDTCVERRVRGRASGCDGEGRCRLGSGKGRAASWCHSMAAQEGVWGGSGPAGPGGVCDVPAHLWRCGCRRRSVVPLQRRVRSLDTALGAMHARGARRRHGVGGCLLRICA